MRVGIVGAGICGLSAARALVAGGHQAVLYEKSRGVGGRIATRREDGFTWDTGATTIAPRGRSLGAVLTEELDTTDLVEITMPIYIHEGLRVMPGHPNRMGPRYAYKSGIRSLPKLLAEGLDVRTECQVEEIARTDTGFRILGEDYDAVVLTPPVPQTATLLWSLNESRPLAAATYRPCLSVNVGVAAPNPPASYHALIDADRRHPMTWLSLESIKAPGRAPEGHSAFGMQFSPTFSVEHYRNSDAELVEIAGSFLDRLYGPEYRTAVASTVMRWKYSQPIGIADFGEVNPSGSRIIIASDGLLGGHMEDAFEVGKMAAARLMQDEATR